VLVGLKVSTKPVTLLEGLAPIRVTCPKTAQGACVGSIVLHTPARSLSATGATPNARKVALGRETFSINRGKTQVVLIALSKRGRDAVRKSGRLRVTVEASARDSAGKRGKFSRAVWLQSPKPPAKKPKAPTARKP
jgi:hypothetical protein